MDVMSKSLSRRIVILQGKLKITEKGKQIHILKFYYIFQCSSILLNQPAD
jgi:hypothetical protein